MREMTRIKQGDDDDDDDNKDNRAKEYQQRADRLVVRSRRLYVFVASGLSLSASDAGGGGRGKEQHRGLVGSLRLQPDVCS